MYSKEVNKSCPSCKSTEINHIKKYNDNGILGPGYYSWLIDEYYFCNKCGIRFNDIKKEEK